MELSPDSTQVLVGGSFTSVNGSTQPGSGHGLHRRRDRRVAAVGGQQPDPQRRRQVSAITSVETDGEYVYASGATYSRLSNLEGIAKMRLGRRRRSCGSRTATATPSTPIPTGDVDLRGLARALLRQPARTGSPSPTRGTRTEGRRSRTRTTGALRTEYLGYFNLAGHAGPVAAALVPEHRGRHLHRAGPGCLGRRRQRRLRRHGGEFPQRRRAGSSRVWCGSPRTPRPPSARARPRRR